MSYCYGNQGSSNKQIYDECNYIQRTNQSVDPFYYEMYFGKHENCNRCIDKKRWYKQDKEIVNVESQLLNITKPLSDCDSFKYNNKCKTSPSCISTFSSDAPILLPQNLCPIVFNNIPIQTNPGYSLANLPNSKNMCLNNADKNYADSYKTMEKKQNMNIFFDTSNNKPLYNDSHDMAYNMIGINPATYMPSQMEDYSDYGNA
jgi:hypothetical protein